MGIVFACFCVLLLVGWLPIRVKNLSFTFWFIQRVVKRCVPLFNIQIVCANPELFTQHQGFIFPNHISYLDIIVIVALTPSRFVAKAEVAKMPFIGWIAQQVQTVFVKRQDKRSRLQTREVLGTLTYYPPVVLFPEGGTNRDLSIPLAPFRLGAFEIAAQHGIPFLPCVIRYNPKQLVTWHQGSLIGAVWRLVSHPTPILAEVITLDVVHPNTQDNPKALVDSTHAAMESLLRYTPDQITDNNDTRN